MKMLIYDYSMAIFIAYKKQNCIIKMFLLISNSLLLQFKFNFYCILFKAIYTIGVVQLQYDYLCMYSNDSQSYNLIIYL